MKLKLSLILLSIFLMTQPVFAAKHTPPPPPVANSVCIDPGHGGTDTGAVNQGLTEASINLQVAQLLKTKLESTSYTAFMTRTGDVSLSNANRYNYCNGTNAAILISIHHNGSSDASVDYTTALYMKKSDVALAELVATNVSSALVLPKNPISRFASGVLLKATMPAAISEGFFLTNTSEYTLIQTSNRLDQEAQALFSAIQAYFGN